MKKGERIIRCGGCGAVWGIDAAPGNEKEWHLQGCLYWDAWVPSSWTERDIVQEREAPR